MPRSLLALAFAVVTTLGWAQEQRTVDGRRYNVHVVERGQTLFAIARVHAVPVEDLQLANPGALDGLSIGEEILVPLDAVVKRDRKRAPTLRENGELLHTVRRKETLYGIAKNYGLDMNALLERNPEALELREGMELVIPYGRWPHPILPRYGQRCPPICANTLFSRGKRSMHSASGMAWIPR
ncbi:MAG: LysM peptidoglycan-binding domain-containing protein [Flavobacteriales bacterium]|nr:LysM peptidoglycan-binding domain-containing protein [Flavobacteriales bacterium]